MESKTATLLTSINACKATAPPVAGAPRSCVPAVCILKPMRGDEPNSSKKIANASLVPPRKIPFVVHFEKIHLAGGA